MNRKKEIASRPLKSSGTSPMLLIAVLIILVMISGEIAERAKNRPFPKCVTLSQEHPDTYIVFDVKTSICNTLALRSDPRRIERYVSQQPGKVLVLNGLYGNEALRELRAIIESEVK